MINEGTNWFSICFFTCISTSALLPFTIHMSYPNILLVFNYQWSRDPFNKSSSENQWQRQKDTEKLQTKMSGNQ